jgi:hypothetical protein
LPEEWQTAGFVAYRMSGSGKQRIGEYPAGSESVRMRLAPRVPVILELRETP